jgi:5-methyltetrahydrofolate--homocysteine methyltransferase
MGTEIQKYSISQDDYQDRKGCNEILNCTRPDIIRKIHCDYFLAGATVVETNTFGGNRYKLGEYGFDKKVYDVNFTAARIAREAVEECGSKENPRFVGGTMGPTGYLPSSSDASLGALSFDACAAAFQEQAHALISGGADILILETMQDLLEVRAAIYGINRALGLLGRKVPLQVQVTMDASGRMLLGSDISAFLGAVANFSPAVLGLNCSTGPAEMKNLLGKILDAVALPVSMIPNAGIPKNVDGTAVYTMQPEEFALHCATMVTDHGVAVTGGCCGTNPEHIRKLSEALIDKKVFRRTRESKTCFAGTGISGIALHNCEKPCIIGERLNAQGSKKTKELVLAENYDELYLLGLEQIQKNASLLDLCVAVNERDAETQTMVKLVRYLSERVQVPFCIDSTVPQVFEQALKNCPGSLLINSINLEQNGDKANKILALAKDFACPVIALPIDDTGMAKTIDQKVNLCRTIVDLACGRFGLPMHYIYFDPLVFTLATGDPESADAANNSLQALSLIKQEFPEINSVMGVSNVSFGLRPEARRVLNNLMLFYATEAGLDAAIFNPLHLDSLTAYPGEVRLLGENLLFNRSGQALAEFAEYFEKKRGTMAPAATQGQPEADIPLPQQLSNKIYNRDKRGLAPLIDSLLKEYPPDAILNQLLLPAMAEVGERMARGEMILPFVLQAAEVMKEAVTILDPYLSQAQTGKKGRLILATVYGDVHDIGKNLVGSILKNQGYEIIDLGKQVPLEEIVRAVRDKNPDAVGLSALLVTTSREMAACVREFDRLGFTLPVLIGGAAVNREFASRIARIDETHEYAGKVFYAKDAFEAVSLLERVKKNNTISAPAPAGETEAGDKKTAREKPKPAMEPPEPVAHGDLLVPPFYGSSEVLRWNPADILKNLKKEELYKGYWRGGKLAKERYEQVAAKDFDEAFAQLSNEILQKDLLAPQGLYAFYPLITQDETVILLSPNDFHTEVAHFVFPRNERKKWRSIADFFMPEGDCAALQVVTIGEGISLQSSRYFEEDAYALGFFLNGLGNYLTECIADRATAEIRRALSLSRDQGKRYGFGYPGLPGVDKIQDILELLCAEDRIGVTVTQNHQMIPEHSTATIFVHHVDADYL